MTASENTARPTVYGGQPPQPGSIRGFASSTKSPGYNSTMSGWSYRSRKIPAISGSGLISSKVSWRFRPKKSRNSLSDAVPLKTFSI